MPDTTPRIAADTIEASLAERFGDAPALPAGLDGLETLSRIAARRVHRRYAERPVDPSLVRLLCAIALSAPSKSDLQQRDIIIVDDPALRASIAERLPHMPWVREAPAFLVFCANGSRIGKVAAWRGKPFPNDHLDLFFNAVGDAAIALSTCLIAAEAVGLGACPISEIRNHAPALDSWLGLPEKVVPFAGLCLGWPRDASQISPRLPLALTVHENRFREGDLLQALTAYDRRREALQPYLDQYHVDRWGRKEEYGWSEQKARQYAVPQRGEFGDYVRGKGFRLD